MRKIALLATAVAAIATTPATAATIMSGSGITIKNIGNTDFTDGSTDGTVYLFREGQNNGVITYLLHYSRGDNDPQNNSGSFDILLNSGKTFGMPATTTAELNASDPNNNATYSSMADRGLESPSTLKFGDSLTTTPPNPVHVTFDFSTNKGSLDEARFFINVGAVPEPASWAMMIVGLGMTGAALRYRRRKSAVAFA